MPTNGFDFSGYATRNDLKCADGRTIRRGAFKDCDGQVVPLVWQHQHNDPANVLGHAILENRDDGVYAYATFNDTPSGQNAKELVKHGDIKAMSIYANQLIQKGRDVLHGMIREVSLVMAGANPGAFIEDVSFAHFDDEDSEFEAIIHNDENIKPTYIPEEEYEEYFEHSDDGQEAESYDDGYYEDEMYHADDEEDDEPMANMSEMTAHDIFESMNEPQQELVNYLVGKALEENASGEDDNMAHNLFDNNDYYATTNYISHDDMKTVIDDAKKYGSLKESYQHHVEEGVLAHAIDTTGMDVPTGNQTYFLNDPNFLFPDARAINNTPEWIKRDTDWVDEVMSRTKHTPFSRIKSLFANITEDEARAKGYLKAHQKTEEVFTLLKRSTTPQTIYKKQKIDRDDILDITDFDVVAWIKGEMRMMLNEEIARAILIGDGRSVNSDDKIDETHVHPIASDAPLFSIQVTVDEGSTDEATAKNMMKAAIKGRKDYRGSGNPVLFTTEEILTSMLLIEDGIGHMMYKSESELATALRVSKIVTVPVMEGHKLANGNELMGIIVNLSDYNVGADKGGEINMFDDFDIDYNQQKYLIETRISGALIKPYSAIVLSKASA